MLELKNGRHTMSVSLVLVFIRDVDTKMLIVAFLLHHRHNPILIHQADLQTHPDSVNIFVTE